MSDQTLAADPFGDGFEEELPVPAQADTSAQPSLTAFEPDVISPLDSDNQDIPVEPLENALNLDVSTVENEIREMISSLNLSSNGLDLDIHRPAVLSDESPSETRMGTDKTSSSSNTPRTTPNSGYGASLLAFANLGSNEHFGEEGFCPFGSSDDRDLLVVEENLEMRHEQVSESNNYSQPTRTPPHSYVQLFSKLRG